MRRSTGEAVKEFEEFHRLLLSRERKQLRELRDQISDKERHSRDDELASASRPAIEHSIRESMRNQYPCNRGAQRMALAIASERFARRGRG